MKQKRKRNSRDILNYSSVEPRRLLAGKVSANVAGEHIFIRGDSADNQIRIFANDQGKISIQGFNGTTVNNRSTVVVENSNLVSGNERIDSDFDGGLRIHMGPGNDVLNVDGIRLNDRSIIYGGTGDDQVSVNSTDFLNGAVVQTFSGDDDVSISNAQIGGAFFALTLDGEDSLTIENSATYGRSIMATGNGNDQLTLRSNQHIGTSQQALTQDGDDVVEIQNPTVGPGGLEIYTGNGDDDVTGEILQGILDGDVIIAGQADDDIARMSVADEFARKVKVRGFEYNGEIAFKNAQQVDYGFATYLKPDDSFFVADFVEFDQTTQISTIEWLGSYENSDAPLTGDRFVIEIYRGGTVEDDVIGEYQAPVGIPVATFAIGDNANRDDTGQTWTNLSGTRKIFSYSAELNFQMDARTQYWISIYSAPTADQGADFNNDYYTLMQDVELDDVYNGAANVKWPNFPNWYPNTSGKTHFTLRS